MTAHTRIAETPPWVQTRSPGSGIGGRVDLIKPEPKQINFQVIAAVLARTPRFGGHTEGEHVLSVAQHCGVGAYAILRDTGRRDWAAAFLLHDAHEAFVGDIPTPVAKGLATHAVLVTGDLHAGDIVKAALASLKSVLDRAIHEAAGVPWPLPREAHDCVKAYDVRMCQTERANMGKSPDLWPGYDGVEPVAGVDVAPWSQEVAGLKYWGACLDLLPRYE